MSEIFELEIWKENESGERVIDKPYWWINMEKQLGYPIDTQKMNSYLRLHNGRIRTRIRKGQLHICITFLSNENYVEFMLRWA